MPYRAQPGHNSGGFVSPVVEAALISVLELLLAKTCGDGAEPSYRDQPARSRLVAACSWAAPALFPAGEVDVSPAINPASISASRAENAALRVAFDAPLSMIARWIESRTVAHASRGIVNVERSSLIALILPLPGQSKFKWAETKFQSAAHS
jgi:hypothetical protein